MFKKEVYIQRRSKLKQLITKGISLFPGNNNVPLNYKSNTYPFRQDSTFLYYFGLNIPGLIGIIDFETGDEIIYGSDLSEEELIWKGPQCSLYEYCSKTGINKVKNSNNLEEDCKRYFENKRQIHYLPMYRADNYHFLKELLNTNHKKFNQNVSDNLIRAVVSQRSIKENCEIEEIEKTLTEVTYQSFASILSEISDYKFEYEIAARIIEKALSKNCQMAYPIICTINGQILHNENIQNRLKKGKMLLIDAGAESQLGYATDITRTYPVNKKFSLQQKSIYELVLETQLQSIEKIKPGISFRDVHLMASRIITKGLIQLELMKGDADEAVNAGAHTLFFPHGLGHMLGLDVHDMENLGEEYVGYDEKTIRSEKSGIRNLRFARELLENFVMTVEPGIYFISELIQKWKSEKRFVDFINYTELEKYVDFGGIRIEDDVLVTSSGCRVLGKQIPKSLFEIESL